MKEKNITRKVISIFLVYMLIFSGLFIFPNLTFYSQRAEAMSVWKHTSVADFANGTFDDNVTLETDGLEAKLLLSNVSGDWEEKYPMEKPNERWSHTMASVWGTDKVILFGGRNNTGIWNYFNDTWEYDLSSNSWIFKNIFNGPKNGWGYTMASVWGTDKLVLYGGYNYSPGYYNETWVYDLSDNTWTKMNPVKKPDARSGHEMTSIWGTDKVLIFGGSTNLTNVNDTWIYDLSDNNWTKMNTSNNPNWRYGHAMAYIWGTDKVVLYGGFETALPINDIWIYDLSDNNWTEKKPPRMPSARYDHNMFSIHGMDKVVMFGGAFGNVKNDTWEYDSTDNIWREIRSITNPDGRVHTSMASFYGTKKALLFGGLCSIYPPMVDDTWIYTLNTSADYENGTFLSEPFDTHSRSSFYMINWSAINTVNTSIKIQFRTASTISDLNTTSFSGPDGDIWAYYITPASTIWGGHYRDRWMQFIVYLNTTNVYETPVVKNISITYNNLPSTELFGPEDGTAIKSNKPLFIWNFTDLDSSQPAAFQVLIDNDIGFGSIDFNSGEQNSLDQHWQFPNGTTYNVLPEGTLYWKVRTKDIDGEWSDYTLPWKMLIDTKPPTSFMNKPVNNSNYNQLNKISGIASDPITGSGLDKIEIMIHRLIDDHYWNGTKWSSLQKWLLTTGTAEWNYDTTSVEWNSSMRYVVHYRATDIATNIESPINRNEFGIDLDIPYSIIEVPSHKSYLNELNTFSGRTFDAGNSGLNKVEINIMRSNDNLFWNGTNWVQPEKWLMPKGIAEWSYDSTDINWNSDTRYVARSRASDNASNVEVPGAGTIFFIDLDKPDTIIDIPFNNSFVNKLDTVSGRSSDEGGSELVDVRITIRRMTDLNYWDGSDWSSEESWLPVSGTTDWSYDTSAVTWTSDTEYIIRTQARDNATNVEIPGYGNVFIFDSEKPRSSVTYPQDNSYLKGLGMITGNASDTGGSGLRTIEIMIKRTDDNNYWSGSSWSSKKSWLSAKGTKHWNFETNNIDWQTDTIYNIVTLAEDFAGNVELPFPGIDFMYDDKPPKQSIYINDDAMYTNTTDVILSISAGDTGSGVSSMTLSTDMITWSNWEVYETRKTFTLPESDGIKYVYLKVQDLAGNVPRPVFDSIILDMTPPEDVRILINNDAVYTNSIDISLELNAFDSFSGLSRMSFSIDSNTWTPWEPFNNKKEMTLPSGDGEKIVYFRVSDNAGNIAMASDTIILDTEPPHSLWILINKGALVTSSTSVNIMLSAVDNTSGVSKMSFSEDGIEWSDWKSYIETGIKGYILSSGDGEKRIYFKVIDEAGNIAEPVSDSILLNTGSPKGESHPAKESDSNFINIFILIIIFILITILYVTIIRKRKRENQLDDKKKEDAVVANVQAEKPLIALQPAGDHTQPAPVVPVPVPVTSIEPVSIPPPVPMPKVAPKLQLPPSADEALIASGESPEPQPDISEPQIEPTGSVEQPTPQIDKENEEDEESVF